MRIKSFSYVVVAVVYASIQIQKRIFRNQRIIIEKFSDVILIVNENFRNIEGERGKQKKIDNESKCSRLSNLSIEERMSRETHLSPNCDEAHEKVEMNKITKNCQRRFEKKKLQKQIK